jgi:hypothetical protein
VKERGLESWTRGTAGALPKQGGGFQCHGAMWQHVGACFAFCLGLKHVCGGIQSVGNRQWPLGPPQQRQ